MESMNTYSSSDLATLGELLHDDGIEAHLDDLRRVVASAEVFGVAQDVRSSVLDPQVPTILRLRAFSVVARELTRDHASETSSTEPQRLAIAPRPAAAIVDRPIRSTRRRAVAAVN
jgi:hypothetical protein